MNNTRIALVGAPLLWVAGWTVMRAGGNRGANAGWDIAHSLWIVAFVLFPVAAGAIARKMTGSVAARIGYGLTVAGCAALGVQVVIDLVVGLVSADHAAMNRHYESVFGTPGVELVFYQLGPILFYLGLPVLLITAALRGTASWAAALLTTGGVLMSAVGHGLPGWARILEGIGVLVLGAGLIAGAGRPGRTAEPGQGRIATADSSS